MHVLILTIKLFFILAIGLVLAVLVPVYLALAAPLVLAWAANNFFITANERLRALAIVSGLVGGGVLVVRYVVPADGVVTDWAVGTIMAAPTLLLLASIPVRRWRLRQAALARARLLDWRPRYEQAVAEAERMAQAMLAEKRKQERKRARTVPLDELLEPRT